ncbi:MAG: ABC transporter permease subunit [Nitrospirae bacterium]|nr:ABC transporter permease subunit [Nitrospirota bacterium]
MRNFYLIFKKELNSYFYSPIAYVVITIFLIITGYFFYTFFATFSAVSFNAQIDPAMARQYNLLNITESVVRPLFGNISIWMLFLMPLLTMRLFAEEKRSGTIELLLTYPVRDIEVVLGKFAACLGIFAIMLLFTFIYPVMIKIYGRPELGPIITGYIGLFLMGAAFISFGIFASSLTENQVVAAVLSFGVLLLFWIIGYSIGFVSPPLVSVLSYIALTQHLEGFAKGVIDSGDVIYYLNFIMLCLFLTLRALESKRWRG